MASPAPAPLAAEFLAAWQGDPGHAPEASALEPVLERLISQARAAHPEVAFSPAASARALAATVAGEARPVATLEIVHGVDFLNRHRRFPMDIGHRCPNRLGGEEKQDCNHNTANCE